MSSFDAYLDEENAFQFSNESLILQSEYFNILFQKSIEELGDKINVRNIMVNSGQEVAYHQFSTFFKDNPNLDIGERKKIVEDYYSYCGFGKISLKHLQVKGGNVETPYEHYGEAWKKWYELRGEEDSCVGYFTLGFLCGVTEALFDVKHGTFEGKQVFCISKGHPFSRFEIFRGLKKKLHHSPGLGVTQEEQEGVTDVSGVNAGFINESIQNLKFSGLDREDGYMEQFDRIFTKHYANYFALVCVKLLMQAEKKLGPNGLAKIKQLITSCAESNAYYMMSGLIGSSFWQEKIAPDLLGTDSINLVHAGLDAISGFGFGKWELNTNEDDEFRISIVNNFETNAYLKLVGNTKTAINFYTGGFLCGMVNLITSGNATSLKPDADEIQKLLNAGTKYEYVTEQSRMVGAERDVFLLKK